MYKGNNIEKVHIDFRNQMLDVKINTINVVAYTELIPLLYSRLFTNVKFWDKVICRENFILRNSNEDMYINCEKYKSKNWAHNIKKIWLDLGFNDIWIDF
jgi:hypothetical protein